MRYAAWLLMGALLIVLAAVPALALKPLDPPYEG